MTVGGLRPFCGRPFGIVSGTRVSSLILDVGRRNVLAPVVIEPLRGADSRFRVVSKRHQCHTTRLLKRGRIRIDIHCMGHSRTTMVLISDGLRQDEVLPDRGTFTCGLGLRTLGHRKGEDSLALSRFTAGLSATSTINRGTKRDHSAICECVHLAGLVPRLLRLVSRRGVTFSIKMRLSCLSRGRRHELFRVVRESGYAPSCSRTFQVRHTFGSGYLSGHLLREVVSRRGPGRHRILGVSVRGMEHFTPGTDGARLRSFIVGTYRRCEECLGGGHSEKE